MLQMKVRLGAHKLSRTTCKGGTYEREGEVLNQGLTLYNKI